MAISGIAIFASHWIAFQGVMEKRDIHLLIAKAAKTSMKCICRRLV